MSHHLKYHSFCSLFIVSGSKGCSYSLTLDYRLVLYCGSLISSTTITSLTSGPLDQSLRCNQVLCRFRFTLESEKHWFIGQCTILPLWGNIKTMCERKNYV